MVVGLVLLVVGAEYLVRGAAKLAAAAGISSLVIGLTVVAFGTSAPEMAVSAQAALDNNADIALGNVVGSNIFNVLFILGASSLIVPLLVHLQLLRLDVPIMIGISIFTYVICMDGLIGRLDGIILFAGIITYTVFLIIKSRKETKAAAAEVDQFVEELLDDDGNPATPANKNKGLPLAVVQCVGGLVMLVLGSRWLVDGAIHMAEYFGVSQLVIGLTIVAAGTSLPEVATSIVAAIRGERDIAIGNVVGSNIFNILAVLGIAGTLSPNGVHVAESALAFDIPVMIGVAILCFPIFFTGGEIARWEGILFLLYYVAYTTYLVLHAKGHPAVDSVKSGILYVMVPLTIIAVAASLIHALKNKPKVA